MARIVVVAHEHDLFETRAFHVRGLIPHWERAGHEVHVRSGIRDLPGADVAFLHVDASLVPPAYADALARYPVVINGRTGDTRKRAISRHLLRAGEDYRGPVIVKTDRNAGGIPELLHIREARRNGEDAGPSGRFMTGRYPIFASRRHVPPALANDPELVLEKFLPERDPRGFVLRVWIFLGAAERCSRLVGKLPVVKGVDVIDRVPCEVPAALRARRAELGFDYGKFDFVLHDGEPVLLDVNRTPTGAPPLAAALDAGAGKIAEGIEGFCGTRA